MATPTPIPREATASVFRLFGVGRRHLSQANIIGLLQVAARPVVPGAEPARLRIPGRLTRVLYNNIKFGDGYGGSYYRQRQVTSIEECQVVSSQIAGTDLHAPVLDLDCPHELISSSTPGHSHLYLDVPMTWKTYKRLLRALYKAGVIERGYYRESCRRKHSDVRAPWVRKVPEGKVLPR